MTTTVTSTIKPSGGDYTTLTAWEAGKQGNLTTAKKWAAGSFSGSFTLDESLTFAGSGATGKLILTDNSTYILFHVTTGTPAAGDTITGSSSAKTCVLSGTALDTGVICVAECYTFSGGLTDQLAIAGSTTDSTRYLKVTVATGNRHLGIPKSAFYITKATTTTYTAVVTNSNNYTVLEYLDVENTGAVNGAYGILMDDIPGTLRYCIAKTTTNAQAVAIVVGAYTSTYHSLLAYGGTTGVLVRNRSTPVSNSVAANCTTGFSGDGVTSFLQNCVAYNNTTNYGGSWDTVNSRNNATSTGSDDAPGGSSVISIVSGNFVNAASNNFHLASGTNSLVGAGVDLSATFTTDVDGDTWPNGSAWDIGIDYRTSGAPAFLASFNRFTLQAVNRASLF